MSSQGTTSSRTFWTRGAWVGRRIPVAAQVALAVLYVAYWVVISGLVSSWGTGAVLAVWLASTIALMTIIGFGRAGLLAAATVGLVALTFSLAGGTTGRLDDATAVALFAWADNYEPDAGPVASCDRAADVNLPGRVTYTCRAGFCKHRNEPVYRVRVKVVHYVLTNRWTYNKSAGGLGPRRGSINPSEVNPVDCSAFGPGR